MKRFFLLIALLCASPLLAQDNWAYNFVTTGTKSPGRSFANTGITSFAISWNTSNTVASCAVQVDSSADGVSWGSGDLIASQNCAVVGSVAATALASGKNFVRINVTALTGNGGLNVTLIGGAGQGSSSSSLSPAPIMGYYLSNACATGTIGTNGLCFNTPANTQMSILCTYTSGSTVVTCRTLMRSATAAVLSNVATYTFPANIVASWAIGNSITVTGFVGGDAFFNQTCTLTATAATSVSCALVHANASSVATNPGIVTNTSAGPFTAFDAGTGNPNGAKRIFGYASCIADPGIQLATNNNQSMTNGVLTIAAFVSSLQVTLSGNATNSSGANTGCVMWGNTDDTAAAAMDTVMLGATQCPRAHLAAAYYMFTVPHFYNQPNGCTPLPGIYGTAFALGAITYAEGFELDGRGVGTTVIYLTPSFPESGGCTNGGSKVACFVVPLEARFSNFMITGGGNYTSPNFPIGTNLMEVDGPATLEYHTCVNFGAGAGNSVGLALYNWAQISFINGSACGDLSLATSQPTISVTAFRVSMESPRNRAFAIGELNDYASQNVGQFNRYNFICYDCYALNQGLSGGAMALMRISNGLSVKLYNYRASKYIGGLGINGNVGLQIQGTAGGKIDIQDSYFDMTAAGTSTSTGDIGIDDQSGAIVHIENSIFKGTSGGFGYKGVAASKFNSSGGNIVGGMSVNAGGLLSLNPTDDLSVATGVTPTCPTVTGATATCAAVAGSTNEKGTLRMTVSAAGTATGTVTMNFVGTFQQTTTPSCVFNPALTGTGAWNARATTFLSTRSSTAPIVTWDNNAANLGNLTWDIDYTCAVR